MSSFETVVSIYSLSSWMVGAAVARVCPGGKHTMSLYGRGSELPVNENRQKINTTMSRDKLATVEDQGLAATM